MDKYEYKVRADEIKRLIGEGDYAQAADIADTIDWRRVKSVMMLCMVSDLYKINRRYEDAKNMLLLAYERRPGGRTICYSLCELCLKTEEFLQAVNYYKEFVQAAPKDPGRYILQYRIYEAQEVSLEERIGVLEELKKRDYREKWAYELAYLYHRVGLGTRCVEECDELILWFGSGKYVTKAMELKMLHQPLTDAQQEAYAHRFDAAAQKREQNSYGPENPEQVSGEYDSEYHSGEYGSGEYGSEEYTSGSAGEFREADEQFPQEEEGWYAEDAYGQYDQEEPFYGDQDTYGQSGYWDTADGYQNEQQPEKTDYDGPEELDIQVKTMDVGKFNTINLQEELAAGLQEVLGAAEDSVSVPEEKTERQEFRDETEGGIPEKYEDETNEEEIEVFFGETGEIRNVQEDTLKEAVFPDNRKEPVQERTGRESGQEETLTEASDVGEAGIPEKSVAAGADLPETHTSGRTDLAEVSEPNGAVPPEAPESGRSDLQQTAGTGRTDLSETAVSDKTGELVMRQMREETADAMKAQAMSAQPPEELAEVLSQEANGQIRFVMPESAAVEKQITGQMKIEDILSEWERMKRENQEKCREEVRRHVLQQTGPMFTEFEAAVRDGLLEQLETGENAGAGPETGELPEEVSDMAEPGEAENREGGAEDWDYEEPEEFGQEEPVTGEGDFSEDDFAEGAEEFSDFGEYEGYFGNDENEVFGEDEFLDTDTGELPVGARIGTGAFAEEAAYEAEEYISEAGDDVEAEEYAEKAGDDVEAEVYDPEAAGDAEPEKYAAETGDDIDWEEYAPGDEDDADFDEYVSEGEDSVDLEEYSAETVDNGDSENHAAAAGEDAAAEEYPEEAGDNADLGNYASGTGEDVDPEEYTAEDRDDGVSEDDTPESGDADEPEEESATEEDSGEENRKAGRKKHRKAAKSAGNKKQDEEKEEKEEKEAVEKTPEKQAERPSVERDQAKVRALTREEKELYAPFIQSRRSREQLVKAIDNISMAAYTGNLVVTGEEGMDTMTLVQNIIREVQMTDSNFSGKVAKISGKGLNERDVRKTLEEMNGGALIIYAASGMNADTAKSLYRSLQQERLGIIVALEDTRKAVQKLFEASPELTGAFTARIDVEALSNDTLVLFGKRYAREMEYSIDELGVLALHTRIEEMQTIDHAVTVVDVKKIVDEAIRHASRKTLGHFFDILFAKRYDEEDMVILTEKDFVA